MLGMGLVLFTVKALRPRIVWPERMMKVAFWGINVGLAAMVLLSVLPVGLLQTWAAVDEGYWYARSEAFLQSPLLDTLRWLRVIGDTIFAIGAITFVLAVASVTTGRRARAAAEPGPPEELPKATTQP
jgi:nitric oxide reductase subunit B